ncbi:MAG: hypothetical protein M3M99_02190 [Actinomycetota bacterium]|nr:hypothetical protein [Actinomycetota bacterium]
MDTILMIITLVEVGLLVIVLVAYLLAIAGTLGKISDTVRMIRIGVLAIDKQVEPIEPQVRGINESLGQVADALGDASR